MKAALPVNELLRIQALHDLAVLDTPREQNFDDVAQVAMQLCDVPIAVVSLVDRDRQWFKSCLGLDAEQTPRDVAFCAHAILNPDDVLVIEDATKDLRFVDNALVTGAPFIRFYAGAPLITNEGFALGTLCVIDYKPRRLDQGQLNSLKALARQVMQLLILRSTHDAMRQHSERLRFIADNVPVMIGELDIHQQYSFVNQKYADWLGVKGRECLGKKPGDIYPAKFRQQLEVALLSCLAGNTVSTQIVLPQGRALEVNHLPQFSGDKITAVLEVAIDATERNAHLKMMQRERARLEAIIEGTNIGTWEWDLPSGNVLINERWAAMLGYSLAELAPVTVETWLRLLHPEDTEPTYETLHRHLAGETDFYACQFRMLCKSGDWLWVQVHGKVVARDTQGNPLVVSGMHTDISEIKATYDRLKEREDLLRSLLSNFPGAAYRCANNASWTMYYLSDAVAQLTGYDAGDFIGDSKITFTAITHPDDVERISTLVQQALDEHRVFDLEYRICRADGEWRHMQEIGRGVYDDKGALQFIDGFIWDVQERHDSEQEKHAMTNKLRQLFEMAPIGILQVDNSGRFLEANPEFCRLTGYSQEELTQMTFLDITPEEDWDKSKAAAAEIQRKGRFGPVEKHYRRRDGKLLQAEISGSLIDQGEGNRCWWTLVKDISEQKRIERMKNEFISTVSHELRTPLTSITGALGLMTHSMLGSLPEKAQGIVSIAYKNSQRLAVLINDLLDMEKLLAGKMYFDFKIQPIRPLVEQAIDENQAYADSYGVSFVLQDEAPAAHINIDAFRLQQVLNNLLSNAAKYSQRNGHVDISLQVKDGWLRVSVRDYGAGIPPEFRTRIFQKFSQADATNSRQKGGTGLGLAISKELVERMAGRIGFDSELGQGSCFFAEFPLDESHGTQA